MRALVLSDIHANIDALDAVLAAAPPHDAVWNLGDLVGYGAAPNPVLQRVREIGTVFVRGNHDRACSGLMDAENFNPIALAAVRWTARQLDPATTQWLREMPRGPVGPCGTSQQNDSENSPYSNQSFREVQCVHGSLLDEDEYILSIHTARVQLAKCIAPINFFGHTHIQGGYAMTADGECHEIKPVQTEDADAESYELDLRDSAKYLINPGSVGQPRDRDWRAAFAVYDDEKNRVSFWRVPYDVRLAQMRIQRARLPDMLATRLRVGR